MSGVPKPSVPFWWPIAEWAIFVALAGSLFALFGAAVGFMVKLGGTAGASYGVIAQMAVYGFEFAVFIVLCRLLVLGWRWMAETLRMAKQDAEAWIDREGRIAAAKVVRMELEAGLRPSIKVLSTKPGE